MQNIQIPTCFFPTTALFIDDNRDFLLNFVLQLDESIAYRIFDNPLKALEFLDKSTQHIRHQSSLNTWNSSQRDLSLSQKKAPDYSVINAQVYNPNRFAEISVVVVDYAMPEMDGLEFCRQIKNSNIKKILLTGQADEKLAVEAFNEGLIDRYITKNDDMASEKITQSIFELQKEYFAHVSEQLSTELLVHAPMTFKQPAFRKLFEHILNDNGIVEYYLADDTGSFFMLDEDANASFLIVKDDEQMQAFHQKALLHGLDEQTINDLKNRKKIPALFPFDMLSLQQGDWTSHLLPAKSLDLEGAYYFAYQKGHDLYRARLQKILSYNRYLEELDGEELLAD